MRSTSSLLLTLLLATALTSFLHSCTKDPSNPNRYAQVAFKLTDAPCDYDHLYLDVVGLEYHTDSNGWETADPFNAGIYDLLELTNGLDTLLCQLELPEGKLSQVRLILGENNELVIGSNTYPIKVPSGQQSGLKLNLHQYLDAATSYTIWLDFDACKSVVVKGNGNYSLKPVIRAFSDSTNGKLKGYVLPDSLPSYVYAIDGSDSFMTISRADGFFMICGLDGTYDLFIEPTDTSVADSLIQNIAVDFGEIVDMDTIQLN